MPGDLPPPPPPPPCDPEWEDCPCDPEVEKCDPPEDKKPELRLEKNRDSMSGACWELAQGTRLCARIRSVFAMLEAVSIMDH